MRWLLLFLFMPSLAWAALPAGTAWDVRTTGADTNSGCFIAGGTGTDYSQQNAPQYALTNGVTNGSTTITTTSAATDMKDNCVYVSGGSGSVSPIRKWITAVSAGTSITVDSSTGLTAGTGVTLNVGGSLATWGTLSTNLTSGNYASIKGGPFSVSSGVTFVGGGAPRTRIVGYTTTRGDGGQATIQSSAGTLSLVNISNSNAIYMYNLTSDCNSQASCTSFTLFFGDVCYNCKAKNYSIDGFHGGEIIDSEVTGGQIGAMAGILGDGGNTSLGPASNNWVHDGVGPGIITNQLASSLTYNIISNQSGATADCYELNGNGIEMRNNIAYNCGRDAVRMTGYSNIVLNNILDSPAEFCLNSTVTQPASPFYDGNAYYNCGSGNRNNVDNTTASSSNPDGVSPYTNTRDIILSVDPFVSASGNNFSLNNTGGGGALLRAHGIPSLWPGLGTTTSYVDMGAVQHQDPVASAGTSATFGQ